MAKPFEELRKRMSPEAQEQAKEKANKLLEEIEKNKDEFSFKNDQGSFFYWFVMTCLGDFYSKNHKVENLHNNHKAGEDWTFDVELIVNGIKIPARKTLNDMYDQLERMLTEKANEMIQDKCNDLIDRMQYLTEQIENEGRIRLGFEKQYDDD